MKIRDRKLQRKKTTAEQRYAVADIPKENVIFTDDPKRKIKFTRQELKDQLRQMTELARGLGAADVSGEFAELRESMLDDIIEKTSDILADKGMVFDLRRKIPYCGVMEEGPKRGFRCGVTMEEDVDNRLSAKIHPHNCNSEEKFIRCLSRYPHLMNKMRLLSEEEGRQPIEIDLDDDEKYLNRRRTVGGCNETSMLDYDVDEETWKEIMTKIKDIDRRRKAKRKIQMPSKPSKKQKEIRKAVKRVALKKTNEQFGKRSAAAKKGWETRRKN